ncbi:hypothetical protein IGI04_019829 [Brassica rapa subsp. trilocularis]|uniref:Uncharacterized protein n=1 Tax=Brassica rapa subsp. trilocularis TaxID=1813537 RepID=A0ABQ7MHV0_BRACM|nr:hypothetical protein IGI04_019829 [Brassica rapa subsp. trilocularis]
MAATKMFLIKWYSSSTNLETSGMTYLLVVWKSSGLLGSLLTKSSGLPGSRLDFQEVVWTSRKSFLIRWYSSSTNLKSSGSCLDFLKVVWTSCKVVWKSSELPKSLLTKSSELPGSRLDFLKVVWSCLLKWNPSFNNVFQDATYNSVVQDLRVDDLTFSRFRLQISKSIAKITSVLTRRLPGKSSTVRQLPGKSSTVRRRPNSLAYIRLLQAHRITNESHPPRIVSFYDSMNHKNFRIKILVHKNEKRRRSFKLVVHGGCGIDDNDNLVIT